MFQINMRMCDEITRIYEQQAEDCVRAVNRLYDEITELARKTCFEPLVNFSNEIYRFYYGTLREHLMREFQNWYDGPSSFHALMSHTHAGDAAIQAARSKMDVMEQNLEGMFRFSADEVSFDTSAPEIRNEDFEDYRQALSSCVRSFENALQDAESSVRSMGSDNDVVLLITDIVKTTGESLTESFGNMVRQVTEGENLTDSGVSVTVGGITGRGKTVSDMHLSWVKGESFM